MYTPNCIDGQEAVRPIIDLSIEWFQKFGNCNRQLAEDIAKKMIDDFASTPDRPTVPELLDAAECAVHGKETYWHPECLFENELAIFNRAVEMMKSKVQS